MARQSNRILIFYSMQRPRRPKGLASTKYFRIILTLINVDNNNECKCVMIFNKLNASAINRHYITLIHYNNNTKYFKCYNE